MPSPCHIGVRRAALHWRLFTRKLNQYAKRVSAFKGCFHRQEDAEPLSAACCHQDDLKSWVAKVTFFSLYPAISSKACLFFIKKFFNYSHFILLESGGFSV